MRIYINGSELANKRFIKLENGDLREVPKGKFIPEIGECYYCLECLGNVQCFENEGRDADKRILKRQPVFKTYEECEDYQHFLETLDQYTFEPNWDDESQEKWYLRFNHNENKLSLVCRHDMQHQGVCFESKEKAKAFIVEIGEEAIERYLFDYWR